MQSTRMQINKFIVRVTVGIIHRKISLINFEDLNFQRKYKTEEIDIAFQIFIRVTFSYWGPSQS